MAVPVITFDVAFIRQVDGTMSIRTTSTVDWNSFGIDPADVVMSVQLTGPDGLVFHPADLDFPDINPSVSEEFEDDCPPAVDGTAQTGIYFVKVLARVSAPSPDTGDYESNNEEHELCADYPELDLSPFRDCLYVYATLTDDTPWATNGFTVNSRLITLTWPQGVTGQPPMTTTAATLSTGNRAMYTGTYSGLLEVNVTKGNFTADLVQRVEFKMDCPKYNLCNLLCCLQGWVTKSQSKNNAVAVYAQGIVSQLTSIMQVITAASSCGNQALLDNQVDQFYLIGECSADCSCSSADSTGPTLIVPIHPGSTGASVTFIVDGGTGVSVSYNSGTSTYTVSLNAATIAFIAASYNTVVTSPLGTITIGAAVVTAGNPPTHTFQMEVAKAARDSIKWKTSWDVRSQVGIMSSPEIVGTTFSASLPGGITMTSFGGSVNGEFWRVENFIASGTPQFIAFVKVANRTLTAAFQAAFPYDKICEAVMADFPFTTNPASFAFGLMQTCPYIGGRPGSCMPLSFYDSYLATIEMEVEIYKLG